MTQTTAKTRQAPRDSAEQSSDFVRQAAYSATLAVITALVLGKVLNVF